jgi:hypothetical protein
MEYGLMLGFNKYVIPFQRDEEELPFNVAALDTIKYTNQTFEQMATEAIDQAISSTLPDETKTVDINQRVYTFALSREATVVHLESEGEKAIFQLGSPVGFNLLNDFSGMQYIFLGNFTHLRPETVLWRARMLERAIDGRRNSWEIRVRTGILTQQQADVFDQVFEKFAMWLVLNTDADKEVVVAAFNDHPPTYETMVYSLGDIDGALDELGDVAG